MQMRRPLVVVLGVLAALTLLFFLLPPLITSNFLFRDYLERQIGQATGCRVEIASLSVSSWTGRFKIVIPTLDCYEANESGKPLASLDFVRCEMYPWQIIPPLFGLHNGTIRDFAISRSGERLKTFLKRFPYLDLETFPVWEDESRDAYLRRLSFSLEKHGKNLRFSAHCDVECPALTDAFIIFDGSFSPSQKTLQLSNFLFQGRRHTKTRTIKSARIVEETTDIPFSLAGTASFEKDETKLSKLRFEADQLFSEGELFIKLGDVNFSFKGDGDFTQNLAALCGLTHRVSRFNKLSYQVEGKGIAKNKTLETNGNLAFKDGVMLGVALTNAVLNFSAQNDHLTALVMTSSFWRGNGVIKAKETETEDQQKLLKTSLFLERLALSDLLEYFRCRAKMPGGTLSLEADLFLTNGTLTACLEGGDEVIRSLYGSGTLSAHNVNLGYFTQNDWFSGEAPKLLQRLLGTGAALSNAKEELPFLQQIMQSLGKEKLRNYTAVFMIRDGALQTPATTLGGNLGEISASGECSLLGELDYKLDLKLNEKISAQYARQPLASMFFKGSNIVIPIKLKGSLLDPKATLNLTPEQRVEFEERTLKLVTDFYNDKLKSTAARLLPESEMENVMEKIEHSVKELLKKLL